MNDLEKIMMKANELGHLLAGNEIVKRYLDLSARLESSEAARGLLEAFSQETQEFQRKQQSGEEIGDEAETRLSDLEKKVRDEPLIREFLATQGYYLALMEQVNERISRPEGEPPTDSKIIIPGQGSGIITP